MLKRKITEEELYKHIDDYDIYNHYFGAFEFGKSYPSVFREDENPSTGFFKTGEGRIIYHDFSTDEKWGSIKFVAKLHDINYFHAMNKIAMDFGIIEGKDKSERAVIAAHKPKPKPDKKYDVDIRKYNKAELDYWAQFGITEQELLDNFVHPVAELKINYFTIENPNNYLRFVYIVHHKGDRYVKVYSPHDKKFKWCGNVKIYMPFGLEELPYESDTLIITKGQKDRLIWKKYFPDVIALQNESKDSLREEVADLILSKYKRVIVNFDCDVAGKRAAEYYKETYGWETISVPDIYYEKQGIKDFADLVKERGLNVFEKFLKYNKLI
jgi:5S rRNA maturation endonuclease (ribonuclease M5)